MGSIVVAKCQCGLKATISVGGGRMNFRTTCNFPCRCSNCNKLVEVNLLAKPPICPLCESTDVLAYDQPELVGIKGEKDVVEWAMEDELGRDLKLTNGLYLCPGCGNFSLRFRVKARWD